MIWAPYFERNTIISTTCVVRYAYICADVAIIEDYCYTRCLPVSPAAPHYRCLQRGWEAFTSSSGGGGGSAHQPAFTKADAVAVGHFAHEAKVMYKQADEVEDEDLPKSPQAEAREAELKKLHDAGLIDDENFEAEMAAI